MARGGFSRRRSALPGKVIGIGSIVLLIVLVVGVFWFSGQAESRKPEQKEIRVEATNVAPH